MCLLGKGLWDAPRRAASLRQESLLRPHLDCLLVTESICWLRGCNTAQVSLWKIEFRLPSVMDICTHFQTLNQPTVPTPAHARGRVQQFERKTQPNLIIYTDLEDPLHFPFPAMLFLYPSFQPGYFPRRLSVFQLHGCPSVELIVVISHTTNPHPC